MGRSGRCGGVVGFQKLVGRNFAHQIRTYFTASYPNIIAVTYSQQFIIGEYEFHLPLDGVLQERENKGVIDTVYQLPVGYDIHILSAGPYGITPLLGQGDERKQQTLVFLDVGLPSIRGHTRKLLPSTRTRPLLAIIPDKTPGCKPEKHDKRQHRHHPIEGQMTASGFHRSLARLQICLSGTTGTEIAPSGTSHITGQNRQGGGAWGRSRFGISEQAFQRRDAYQLSSFMLNIGG